MVGKGILLGDERVEDVPRDARGNPARRQGAGQGEGGLGAAREEPQAARRVERGDKRAKPLKLRAKNRNLSEECV